MPRSSRPLARFAQNAPRIAVALSLGMSAAAIAAACGNTDDSAVETVDGSDQDGALVLDPCPSAEPQNGSECLLPEGTTCDFGACGTRLAQCTGGAWAISGNAAPQSICPAVAPNAGVSCPPCWNPSVSCAYGSTDCTLPDASDNTTLASCRDAGWTVTFAPCRDAGPDVQGDGDTDAD